MAQDTTSNEGRPMVAFDRVALRKEARWVFRNTRWIWRRGEQWTILGPNGSGKSLLARALAGAWPVARGEIQLHFAADGEEELAPEQAITLVSPALQQTLIAAESSFYQSRWHSGIGEGRRTVAQFLSQASVEHVNPFEVGLRLSRPRAFRRRRHQLAHWFGLGTLLRRKLIHLSNGEQRKALLVAALLRSPRLLILDDPFGGLDRVTRLRLKQAVPRLMRAGLPVLWVVSRPDEVPPQSTHLLLVEHHRVVAAGPRKRMLRHRLARALARQAAPVWPRVRAGAGRLPGTNRARTPLVELNHVTIRYGTKRLLDDVSWTVRPGEHWALLGPNGAGKTTLLSLLQGDNPQAYAVDLRLFGLRPDATHTFWQARQHIGWMSPELHLQYPPEWPCRAVVCSGFFNSVGLYQGCSSRQRVRAAAWLRALGLAGLAGRALGEVPLGDQRLVMLARAVVKKPRLLILDEPCQGLDATHRQRLLDAVDRVVAQTGAALICVTHHPCELPRCISRVVRLRSGRVAAQTSLRERG